MSGRPKVFVALPNRPGEAFAAGILTSLFNTGSEHDIYDVRAQSSSLLALNFNDMWCMALNERFNEAGERNFTHFVMLHSDIYPERGWISKLLAEQREAEADIVSAVVPIKDERGLTSTGIMDPSNNHMCHITMKEACAGPVTFDASGAGHPGKVLLINSGCWICDFTKPWVEDVCFRIHDAIVKLPDGRWAPKCVSEDWLFSIDAWRMKLRVFATMAVKLKHQGGFGYPNFAPWGSWEAEREPGIAHDVSPANRFVVDGSGKVRASSDVFTGDGVV